MFFLPARAAADRSHVGGDHQRISIDRLRDQRGAIVLALSITASTPCQLCGVRSTGMPPPPPQITTLLRLSSQAMGRTSTTAREAGEGTTRQQQGGPCVPIDRN
jgi:hypothetical protein